MATFEATFLKIKFFPCTCIQFHFPVLIMSKSYFEPKLATAIKRYQYCAWWTLNAYMGSIINNLLVWLCSVNYFTSKLIIIGYINTEILSALLFTFIFAFTFNFTSFGSVWFVLDRCYAALWRCGMQFQHKLASFYLYFEFSVFSFLKV